MLVSKANTVVPATLIATNGSISNIERAAFGTSVVPAGGGTRRVKGALLFGLTFLIAWFISSFLYKY